MLRVIQPDVTKWGRDFGKPAGRAAAVAAGKRYCPHYFGVGVAILASLQLLAAAGGDGVLEFDCHPYAGRELVVGSLLPVTEARVPLPVEPGPGAILVAAALECCRTRPVRF